MIPSGVPDLLALLMFGFGALTFSVLSAFYWSGRHARKSTVFAVFTAVCAAGFLNNLLLHHSALRSLTNGALTPLLLHLVIEFERDGLGGVRWWNRALVALYVAGIGVALAPASWSEATYLLPALLLSIAGTLAITAQAVSKRRLRPSDRAHRRANYALLFLMVVCAVANLAGYGIAVGELPDYLLLAFFCVTLYYRERLVFIDVLVKRGVFFALGVALVALSFSLLPAIAEGAIALALWVMGPWFYGRLARAIDFIWLGRPVSAVDAERQFVSEIQAAANEEDLKARATACLRSIFRTNAEVRFDDGASGEAGDAGLAEGAIVLGERPNGAPFLSDDRRLLRSLAASLSVVRDNVRIREHEEQLRLLASRAELKALRAQINPHFLFNALSVIAGLIREQPELADDTVEHLAKVFRYTLRKSEHEWSALGEEVEFVRAYLSVEQARFGARLRVEFEVDPAAARVPIPAMSIQPLIENAIKHGVSAMESGGTVRLRASLENGELAIEVFDSGPGFPQRFSLDATGDGRGLRNVAQRLQGYYGQAARLFWEHGEDGTRVRFTVPVTAAAAVAAGNGDDPRFNRR
ncbi:MAG TPA: histidine kinase [Bryobacteraceae bacterium]